MKSYKLFLVFSIVVFSSCFQKSQFEGFEKSGKGFYYQLLSIGESEKKANIGDYVTAEISYKTITDSLFFEGRRKLKLEKPRYRGSIEDCIKMLNIGESAIFILPAYDFFTLTLETELPSFIGENDFFKIYITLSDIQTEEEFDKEKQAFLNWINDFGDYEKVVLQQYFSEEKLNIEPTKPGLFFLPLIDVDGPCIETGDTITINYEGKFLDGKFFDSTVRRNQPFQFVYGTEWQVIKGLEEGLTLMSEGDKAIFILSSDLAFGKSGSSTGMIPPFTSLIFEVEVLRVIKTSSPQ